MSDSDTLTDTGAVVGGPDEHEAAQQSAPQPQDIPDQPSHSQQTKDLFKLGLALEAGGTEDATDDIRQNQTGSSHKGHEGR